MEFDIIHKGHRYKKAAANYLHTAFFICSIFLSELISYNNRKVHILRITNFVTSTKPN